LNKSKKLTYRRSTGNNAKHSGVEQNGLISKHDSLASPQQNLNKLNKTTTDDYSMG